MFRLVCTSFKQKSQGQDHNEMPQLMMYLQGIESVVQSKND